MGILYVSVCVYVNIIIIQETHFDWNRIAFDAQENEIHHVCEPEQCALSIL